MICKLLEWMSLVYNRDKGCVFKGRISNNCNDDLELESDSSECFVPREYH